MYFVLAWVRSPPDTHFSSSVRGQAVSGRSLLAWFPVCACAPRAHIFFDFLSNAIRKEKNLRLTPMTKALAQSATHRMLNGVVQKKSSHSETRTGGAVVRHKQRACFYKPCKKTAPEAGFEPAISTAGCVRQYQPNTTWAPTQIDPMVRYPWLCCVGL